MKSVFVFAVVLVSFLVLPSAIADELDETLRLLPLLVEEKTSVEEELVRLETVDIHQRNTLIALYLGKEVVYRQELILAHYDLLFSHFQSIQEYYAAEKKSTRNFRQSLFDFEEALASFTLAHEQVVSQYSELSVDAYTSADVRSFIVSLSTVQQSFESVQDAHSKSLQFVGEMS